MSPPAPPNLECLGQLQGGVNDHLATVLFVSCPFTITLTCSVDALRPVISVDRLAQDV